MNNLLNGGPLVYIVAIFISVLISVLFIILIYTCLGIKNTYNELIDVDKKINKTLEQKIKQGKVKNPIKYSRDVSKYLQEIVARVAIIQFREYIDSHDIRMVTRENMKRLAADIASSTFTYIDHEKLRELTSKTPMTDDFYKMYIIHTSINAVKELMEREIDKIIDNK